MLRSASDREYNRHRLGKDTVSACYMIIRGRSRGTLGTAKSLAHRSCAVVVAGDTIRSRSDPVGWTADEGNPHASAYCSTTLVAAGCVLQNATGQVIDNAVLDLGGWWGYGTLPSWLASLAPRHLHSASDLRLRKSSYSTVPPRPLMSPGIAGMECSARREFVCRRILCLSVIEAGFEEVHLRLDSVLMAAMR